MASRERTLHTVRCGIVKPAFKPDCAKCGEAVRNADAKANLVPERGHAKLCLLGKVRKSYCPNSARAVSTRARVGLWPNCENIRFASVRC